MVMKVLFAVDGSSGSFDAVAQVGPLLNPTQDQVALYCAPPDTTRFSTPASPEVLGRARQGLVDAIFDEARNQLPAPLQGSVQTITGAHDARHGIVTAAEEWGAELIVVGARGLGALQRMLLGSVSRAVVHAAKVPVWVARAGTKSVAHPGVNVLVACEDPDKGCRQAEALAAFSWPSGSTCHTLTVVPSMFAGKVPDWLQQQARSPDVEEMVQAWAREHDQELQAMRERMSEYSAKLPTAFTHREPVVTEGEPSSVILNSVAEEKIDVVVLGVHRKSWLTATLLGSTSEAVLNHAPCSVVIVPHS